MAICNYEIHLKGKKQSVLMFYATMRSKFAQAILHEHGTDEDYIMWFIGTCDSDENLYGYEIKNITIDPFCVTEDDIRSGKKIPEFFNLSIRKKSELLGLELLVRSWSKDDDYDQIEHYKNGYFKGVIGYNYDDNYVTEYEF